MTKNLSQITKEAVEEFEKEFNSDDKVLMVSVYGQGYSERIPVGEEAVDFLTQAIESAVKETIKSARLKPIKELKLQEDNYKNENWRRGYRTARNDLQDWKSKELAKFLEQKEGKE